MTSRAPFSLGKGFTDVATVFPSVLNIDFVNKLAVEHTVSHGIYRKRIIIESDCSTPTSWLSCF